MRVVLKQLAITILLLSSSLGQNTGGGVATLQDIVVSREDGDLRVEVILSSPVKAAVTAAHHPDRLLLQLPNTTDGSKRQKIKINTDGVRSIHTVLGYEDVQTTDVVVELDQARPYALSSEGNKIVLTFSTNAGSHARHSEGAAAAAATSSLGGIFHRRPDSTPTDVTQSSQSVEPAVSSGVFSGAPVKQTPQPSSDAISAVFPAAQSTAVAQSSPVSPTQAQSAGSDDHPGTTPPSQTAEVPAADTPALAVRTADPALRTAFKVKYVAEGVAYLDGGRSAGLKEGVKLLIQESDLPTHEGASVDPSDPLVVAELEVTAVAETSAVTDVHSPKRPVKPGDLAYLSMSDAEALVQQTSLSATRKYPAVVTFTDDDTPDEEVREEVPRPPQPSVNRARGRIGFDYMGTISHGTYGMSSSDVGMVFRGDITRINGTYWNLSGFWRGRFTSEAPAGQQTLQDLINRTYHLNMTYDNPNSAWVAGFGRLYLPWASSLDTIDGGYFGRKLSQGTTLGIFGGSTPDPTSYDYSPDRVIGGSFINFTGGDYTRLHYSSTWGAGVSMLNWQLDKPFGFAENVISFTQRLSIYDALQVDSPSGNPAVPAPGVGLSRNFLTLRVQPHPRLELDFNYTYFRDIPTFDPQLIGMGLLDKYLFQGFSVGARVEVKKQIFVYTQLGRSNRTGDTQNSLNQLYGLTFNRLPLWGLRADFHYARFNSSFGSGNYKALSVSRSFTDSLRLEVLAGQQNFSSTFTNNATYRFVTSNVEINIGSHYFLQGGYTLNRGDLSYDQWMVTLGYRFDSKARHHE